MEKRKIAILGGDGRFAVLADRLSLEGYECALWKTAKGNADECVLCADWRGAVNRADAVILPLPTTDDGVTLHLAESDDAPKLTEIVEVLSRDTLLLIGKPPEDLTRYAEKRGIVVADYFSSEIFEIKNALPTVEGALQLALENLSRTICGGHFAVIGYGRIGRLLSDRLTKLGGAVTVYARREESRALAEQYGCLAAPTDNVSCGTFDLIFNTVPTDILSSTVVSASPSVLIDLAPVSRLSHSTELRMKNIRVIDAPALPGRLFPATAGQVLADCILPLLRKKGIVSR